MPVQYTYTKAKDTYTIIANEDISYNIIYRNTQQTIFEGTLESEDEYVIPFTKDGYYDITLENSSESENFEVYVVHFLQTSIIINILYLLKKESLPFYDNCLTDTEVLNFKKEIFFNQIQTYINIYVPIYAISYEDNIIRTLNNSYNNFNCNTQNTINKYLFEECIYGSIKNDIKLYNFNLILYWFIIYYIDYSLASTENEQEFVRNKYKYNTLLECLKTICISIIELENLFNNISLTSSIFSWQYSNLDPVDIGTIDNTFIEAQTEQILADILSGININYNFIGKIGFGIVNTEENQYSFLDLFDNNINDIFDTRYIASTNTQIFISKYHIVNSSIFTKLINN